MVSNVLGNMLKHHHEYFTRRHSSVKSNFFVRFLSVWPSVQKVVIFFCLCFGIHHFDTWEALLVSPGSAVYVPASIVVIDDTREAVSVPLRSPLTRGSSSTISSLFSLFSEDEVLDEAVKSKSAIHSPL